MTNEKNVINTFCPLINGKCKKEECICCFVEETYQKQTFSDWKEYKYKIPELSCGHFNIILRKGIK